MTEERSGMDILDEILKRLDIIEKKLNVLDANTKKIANSAKIAELAELAMNTSLEGFGRAIKTTVPAKPENGFRNFKFESSDASKAGTGEVLAQKSRVVVAKPKKIMAKGKMVANAGEKIVPLANIGVQIFDDKDNLIKETRTNRAGEWMSLLPPGRYVAYFNGEFGGQKLVSQNRNFIVPKELPEGQTNIEVT